MRPKHGFQTSNRLRVLRAERRWTQNDVAIRLRLASKFRYWQIENEEAYPTDKERAKLCKIFNVTEDVIWPERASEISRAAVTS